MGVILSLLMGLSGWADGPVYNLPLEEPESTMHPMETPQSYTLPFDPGAYSFLIYDCGGDFSQNRIQEAMTHIGITQFTVCSAASPISLNLLQSHDILIVGWAHNGDKSGLDPNAIEDGITGRVILSGHDSDFHTVVPVAHDAAATLFIQKIDYILKGGSTGLLVCADIDNTFEQWLPESWGIVATNAGGEVVHEFTDEGLASGVYENLLPGMLSYWTAAYHNVFTEWGEEFVSFELGGSSETDVITIARPDTHGVYLIKTDNRDPNTCVVPNDEIVYTIHYSRMPESVTDLEGVVLVDILPPGVDFLYELFDESAYSDIDPNNIWEYLNDPNFVWPTFNYGAYDPITHTITWPLGHLAPGDSGSVSFVVQVNYKAEPNGTLTNIAELRDDMTVLARTRIQTPVCCWTNGRIYVDQFATGANTGTSWENAYIDLQSALARAANGCGEEIWVAAGWYCPGTHPTYTFKIPDGVSVYGGFAGWETFLEQRTLNAYPSILSGYISEMLRNETVVTMGHETLLDGFTVRDSSLERGQGILAEDLDFSLENCVVKTNFRYGVRALNSNVSIKWCVIDNNGFDGIYHDGNNVKAIIIKNSLILNNGQNGVYARLSTPQILNSQINFNGSEDVASSYGLYLFYPQAGTMIQNNTLAYNANQGIRVTDPNSPVEIRNCILWGNKLADGQDQMTGNVVAFYSCVYDPNDPYQTIPDLIWNNISCDPEFAYDGDPNMIIFRLIPGSPCIDRGDPSLSYEGQLDIDALPRVMGLNVDMGASEFNPDCSDVYNPWDFNADGLVNLYEFAKFSRAWLAHDPNDPAITDPNHLDHWYRTDPNSPGYVTDAQKAAWYPDGPLLNVIAFGDSEYRIDLADLMVFIEYSPWLWSACWRTDIWHQQAMGMMLTQPEIGGQELLAVESQESIAVAEEASPEEERETILGLLEQIDVFIDVGGDDAEAWTELKYLLELNLIELESTINQSEMY